MTSRPESVSNDRSGEHLDIELASFVPVDRRMSERELPLRANGAVLKVDIAGFSELTRTLYERHGSKRGAEQLSEFLNSAFDRIIRIVDRAGGSVITFTGDGMTCWFGGDTAAIACTSAAVDCRDSFTPPDDADDVGIKLAVVGGYTERLALGDPEIQRLDVLGGPTISRVELAERLAKSGEVLVDWNAAGILGAHCAEWRRRKPDRFERRVDIEHDPLPFLVVPAGLRITVEARDGPRGNLRSAIDPSKWVTGFIRERVQKHEGEFLIEYRQIATLFVQFAGVDYGADPRALEKLDAYVRWVQNVIADHEGELCQVVIGDKGSYYYAAFGAPLSHENDAVQAVRGALELANPPDELRYMSEFRAGISSGMMLCGLIGNDIRRTYGVVGAAANESADLMQRAGLGETVVSDHVFDLTEHSVTYSEPKPWEAGRFAYVVAGETVSPFETSEKLQPIVGRDHLLAQFSEWLATSSPGGRLLYIGPPGIGKTRLLREVTRIAIEMGRSVFVGGAVSFDSKTPYSVWKQVFRRILQPYGLDESEIAEHIGSVLTKTSNLEDSLALLSPVLPKSFPVTASVAELSDEAAAEATVGLMLEILADELGSGSLIAIDDAQWMDSASVNLLRLITTRAMEIPVVMTTRPENRSGQIGSDWNDADLRVRTGSSIPHRLRRLIGPDDVVEVLQPLQRSEIEEIVRDWLGVSRAPEIEDLISSKAEGNPLFGVELCRGFLLDGDLEVDEDTVRLGRSLETLRRSVPSALRGRLDSRLSELPGEQQVTLKVASIIRTDFSLDMLRYVHPGHPSESVLDGQVKILVHQGYLAATETGYRFTHDLVREAAHDLHASGTARRIHERAARWMSENQADSDDLHPILAYHFDGAGMVREAMLEYDKAAAQALIRGAYDEAVGAYARAIELSDGPDARAGDTSSLEIARWHINKGRARVLQQAEGERDAKADIERGLELIGLRRPTGVPVAAAVLWEYIKHRTGVKSIDDPADVERMKEAARSYEQLVELNFLAGDEMGSAYSVVKSLNLATKAGDQALIARGLVGLGQIMGVLPRRARAVRYITEAEELAQASGDVDAIIYVSLVRSFYYSGIGNWQEAERSSTLATRLASERRHRRRHEDGLSHLMVQAYFQGRLGECLRVAEELEESARSRGANRNVAYALQGRLYVLIELGALEAAESALDQMAELGYAVPFSETSPGASRMKQEHRPDDEALASEVLGQRGILLSRAGRFQPALSVANALLERMRGERPFNFSSISAFVAPIEVYVSALEAGAVDHIPRDRVRAALALVDDYAKIFPIGAPPLLLWRGRLAKVNGGDSRAVADLLERSARQADDLSMPLESLRAWKALARLGGDDQIREAQARISQIESEVDRVSL